MSKLFYTFLAFFAIVSAACTVYSNSAVMPSPTEQPAPTIAPPTPTTQIAPTSQSLQFCIVNTGFEHGYLNIRSCPGVECKAIALVSEDEKMTLLEQGDWHKVLYGTQTGFVNSIFCEIEK